MKVPAVMTSAVSSTAGTTKRDDTEQTFLTLLAKQLQNQDPTEPMSSEAMLSQISQLTTVSEMAKLNKNFEAMATSQTATDMAALIGRTVEWADTTTGKVQSGTVTAARMGAEGWNVCVGDIQVSVHDVVAVR